jgi:hypothetical protein
LTAIHYRRDAIAADGSQSLLSRQRENWFKYGPHDPFSVSAGSPSMDESHARNAVVMERERVAAP